MKEKEIYWSVTVSRNGVRLVTLSWNELAGRDLTEDDEEAIRLAGEHLLAFVGPRLEAHSALPPPGQRLREPL